jgi:predicted DNA-binding protein (UPF0251 family)
MSRPHKCRRIGFAPTVKVFKPQGIPSRSLEVVELRLDELEALRLADLTGKYHGEAAERMGISRATFGRLLEEARRKVADALLHTKGLRFEGGEVIMNRMRTFACEDCGKSFQVECGTGRPAMCPSCKSENFHRAGRERHGGEGCGRRDHSGRRQHGRQHRHHGVASNPEAE